MFKYSKKWYEEEYHKGEEYQLDKRSFMEVQKIWDGRIHKKRFMEFLGAWGESFNHKSCLEVGCHHGKTMWWALEKFPGIRYFEGIDWSSVAINWLSENWPEKDNQVAFMLADVANIKQIYDEDMFDVVFCVDMIEHIPAEKYFKMVEGIKWVCRPGGKIVLLIGTGKQKEHIHVISKNQAIADFDLPLNYWDRDDDYFVLVNK